MRILVTGTTRGLGRYLFEQYSQYTDVHSFNRGDKLPTQYFDRIIHTAWDDNGMEELMENLLRVPHKTFVFMSTMDLYANDLLNKHTETKRACEQMLRLNSDHYLILRLGSLVGHYMKRNDITRMFDNEALNHTPDSTFGFVTYKQVADLINHEVAFNWLGKTLDVQGQLQTLQEIADQNELKPLWGKHQHKAINIDDELSARIGKIDVKQWIPSKFEKIQAKW